jgi:ankyrin repeat protein
VSKIEKFLKMFPEPPDLWKAARDGDVEKIKTLLAEGENVNAKHDGDTPLHEAAYHKQAEAIKELVQLGGKINAKNDEGDTPIKLAVQNGADTNLVELMIQLGSDINKGSSEPLGEAAASGREQVVQCLLDHGANPNGSAKGLMVPLCGAAGNGNTAVVRMLLKAGANVNPEPPKEDPLGFAAVFGQTEIVRVLLAAGANPNHKDNCNQTPLMSAVMCREEGNKAEIVQALLAAGADVNAKSMDERTALDRAEKLNLPEIIKILNQAGAKRGNELPKVETEQSGTSWEQNDSMVLGADIEPWPAKAGNANLKIEITKDDYSRSFSGTLEYRVARAEKNSDPWVRVFGKTDEDGEFQATVEIALSKGENIVQFRIKGKDDKDFTELEGWPIEVK